MCMSCPPNVFPSFCQFSLTVNAPVCQGFRLLIDYNTDIDSWDLWDCVLFVIGTVSPVDVYFPHVVSMPPLCQCSLMTYNRTDLPLIDCYIDSWVCVLSVIVPVHAYTPPPLMRISLISDPPINVFVLHPVDMSPFLSMLPSVNAFVCWQKAILTTGIVGIVIGGIFGIVFCLFLQPSILLMCPFCMSYQCIPLSPLLLMCPYLRSTLPLVYR